MSFLTSLSGLKAAQTDLSVVSNNIANGNSTGFKKSRASFGDLFAASPTQATKKIAGQGVQLQGITQQFTQGTLQSTDRTLDLAVAGEGFFTVKSPDATASITYTRNGAFSVNNDREVVDSTGNIVQLLPVDANGVITSTDPADMTNLVLPSNDPSDPAAVLANINVDTNGTIVATYSNGNQQALGSLAMASFVAVEGLRPVGDAHWQATGQSGLAQLVQAGSGPMGSVRSGSLETANIDITEELVSLIAAQRNFQANAQAIETANNMTQTIVNLQV
ncbi:flagellar biosynthesis protein FlgG [Candidatus Peregrinibacteria bacterium CG11_big_fil_rev_8_21_14_0_20_41_10]|jgi:flagellar hook protein FlgE|uniref:Flagellar hook protein FlgE n=1 Tax=Blastomonas marina TaxID=1867408 RepID=A0ABQ1FHH7_9SPHN|nr:flagellar hook-basal body complex protein [Blastomonas marina]PIQ78332.1 MAG: flagellar biosynthesis protein FlgG [Candidatus Peregrinibacteria bacterium CG11_big_fil_rev_8_21_14_0_20_41_10]PIW55826.1 MAG: flagellar biosynthesis protein FlgG [Sphingomonadales bacterium CG12_big_fil_rev_8_21_14_0_65_65_10]WPZ03588.1 flagellar hook-basal body complex protein [Blastomonas marina]GGA13174.1 flagellar basal-body rod protein FlgG [Blastomonas marina]